MASARPQVTPAAAAAGAATKQPRTSKKRKASSDAPAAFRASAAAREASGVSAHCSLCGFGASTLDHLLTHVRESHGQDHEQATPQMALPLEVAQMVVQRALDQAALGGATSAWLQAMQQQYKAAAEMTGALGRRDAHGVAVAIRKLYGMTQKGDEQSMLTTLQQATQILLQSPPPAADAAPVPVVAIKQEAQSHNSVATTENATVQQQNGKDSSTHEEEAAQALTGLRATASSATATTTTTASVISTSAARPPAVPKPSPTAPQASFPSFALGSPLTITAPQPQLNFHPPELFTPGSVRSPTTPSSLPSLFARRLLAPLASPSSVTEQGVTGMGYQNPMIVTDQRNPMGSTIRPDTSPASLTPVFYSSFPTLATVNNVANAGATPSNRPTTASPVKRKSITSKQLSVRCDAEVAAARAAASTAAAAADTSGLVPLGPISVPGTPSTPATRKATPRRWTKEEDDALRAAVENHREKNWKAIAAQVPGRNHTQCLQRWTKVLAPGLVKGHWSPHEDELLRRLVATEQKNWGDVASKIPGRTSKQCRERWHNHLDPQIVRGAYTPEEDRLILEAQARLGNRWSVIAAMLPGRTEDAVKIRWKSHCRVWRARKYLRKNPNSDVDMLSEPAQTPRTPLVPPTGDFKWPVSLPNGPADEQESNTSKTSAEATAQAVGGDHSNAISTAFDTMTISSLELALQPTYLDSSSDRASLAILRDIGVSIAEFSHNSISNKDGSTIDVISDEALQNEHSSAANVTYQVVKGCVHLDVRDSADCWVRCTLTEGMKATLGLRTLRRFVPIAGNAAQLLESSKGARNLTARYTHAADAANHSTLVTANDCRELVCELCRLYYTTEWMTGTGGAMSLRHGERIYVTPSGVPKERLQPEDLYVLDLDCSILSSPKPKPGKKAPKLSDCAPLFLNAHKIRKAGVVLHSHGITCNLAAALCDGKSEFRISHQEMIKGITGHGYADTLVVPVIDNAPKESALAEPIARTMEEYPNTSAVLVRRHGLFVWGDSWEAAKRHAECLHYLFEAAIEMRKLNLDYTIPPVSASSSNGSSLKRARTNEASNGELSMAEKHKVVMLDIEGTTTPITFVHDILFPYVTDNVARFLHQTWGSADTKADVAALVAQHKQDQNDGVNPPALDDTQAKEQLIEALTAYVKWNVKADRKIGPLKQLQGHMWLQGYESGELKALVYDDVPPCLERLRACGVRVGIYSSGSRQAQKLLFQYSDKGDLREYLTVYFDTKIGHKREVGSYKEIVQSLGVDSGKDVLFVTDVIEEAQAAEAAGLDTVLSVRPGNKPLPESHHFPTIRSFAEL
ncbi:2,3-diketo-5-methylthio-1-phosphopentane phosphatase [Phytophthora nicotianae]|uniref:2,3-diketo-5-methylthio-1-phosphopentane phosphatase n=1 Tax=Phytophthora nicotianae TaxID=4792 RepID=W2H9G9_PHYNI|nr:2,3-diketo-5-methylthio-1-phosphopentane phosphatase [Phytophthora nicotianae]